VRMGSPPGIGPARSDETEARGLAQAAARPRLMVLEACANSSGLDCGMPGDLWRSGKTTVSLDSSLAPAQRRRAGPENTRSKKQGSIYCPGVGKLNSPIMYEKLHHELPAYPCSRSQ
jgi:hypothetical protein